MLSSHSAGKAPSIVNCWIMPEYVYFSIIAAVVVISAVLLFVLQGKSARERESLVRRYEDQEDELTARITVLTGEKAALESQLESRKELEKQREGDAERMKDAFRALAAENSESFRMRSRESIEEILKPIKEKFGEFSDAVKESQKGSIERHSRLEQKIVDLDKQSKAVGDEARNLANALTGYSKVQGDFGEMLLTDVLKNSGLTEGIHFRTQGVITDSSGHEVKNEQGRTLIPDVIVYYPDDTDVIIDSKVSLTAFNEYMNAVTAADREMYAKAHVESVRKHVDELRYKDYASYIPEGRRKVDYNIMFIPVEGAFQLMLEKDPLLWQKAKNANVLIVSQMTLSIVLNMIMMGWRQHDQEKNIANVYKTASELMSQLRNWLDSYVKVGEQLESARKVYDDSLKKLRDSNQAALKKGDTMLGNIRKLENLGLTARASKAKTSTGSRLGGPESIIPAKLSDGPED